MATAPHSAGTLAASLMALPAFSDNYIWLLHHQGRAVVVDPGEARPVLDCLAAHGLQLDAILLTHHHNDHVGGVLELRRAFPQAVIHGPAHEKLPACDHRLAEGDTVSLPPFGLTLRVIDVPGHTAGHIAYAGQPPSGPPLLFCGDTLFAAGCGRLFEGTPAQMVQSLGKLAALPASTLVCCAHEYTLSNLRWALAVDPANAALQARQAHASAQRERGEPTLPTTLAEELDTNPFLRTSLPSIAAAVGRHTGQAPAGPVEVFAGLREWKNQFR